MSHAPAARQRRLPLTGRVMFTIAALIVVVAAVVGIRGLLADPVESVTADGVATLHGDWEPYSCGATTCEGYVQAGARSVFVVLATGCASPQRGSTITVRGRLDRSLGSGAYRSLGCAS